MKCEALRVKMTVSFVGLRTSNDKLLMKSLELGQISLSDDVSEYGIILKTSEDYIALLKDYLLVYAQIRSLEL